MNLSAIVFILGDFNVYHKNWITYSGEIFLSQTTLLRWLTFLLGPQAVAQTVPLFWIYFFWRKHLFYNGFPSIGRFWYVSVSIDFPSNSKGDAPFHRTVYDYSLADWNGLGEIFYEKISLNSVFLLLVLSSVSGSTLQFFWKCEPKLSYILTELFNMYLKESCFPHCWKVSSVVPVFKKVGKRPIAKNHWPVSLLSVVSKVFEELENNRLVDHLERCVLLSNF